MKLQFVLQTYDMYWKVNNRASALMMMGNSLYVSVACIVVLGISILILFLVRQQRRHNKSRKQRRVVEKILLAQQRVFQGMSTKQQGSSNGSSQSAIGGVFSRKRVDKKVANATQKIREQLNNNLKHRQDAHAQRASQLSIEPTKTKDANPTGNIGEQSWGIRRPIQLSTQKMLRSCYRTKRSHINLYCSPCWKQLQISIVQILSQIRTKRL